MTPEGKVKQEVKKYLESLGPDCWWFMPMTFGYGKSGVPDFIICYKGRFLAPETKKKGGKSEPWQEREQIAIVLAGGMSDRVISVEQVKDWIAKVNAEFRNAL